MREPARCLKNTKFAELALETEFQLSRTLNIEFRLLSHLTSSALQDIFFAATTVEGTLESEGDTLLSFVIQCHRKLPCRSSSEYRRVRGKLSRLHSP